MKYKLKKKNFKKTLKKKFEFEKAQNYIKK